MTHDVSIDLCITVPGKPAAKAMREGERRVVSVAAGGNTESYQYDLLGGVTGVVKTIRGQQYTIGASYDLAGGITSLSYPSGRTVTIARDSLGRAASIASGGKVYAQSFDYAPSGALSSWTLGNGIVATRTYSPERMTLATLAYTRGGQPIFHLGFDYAQPTGTGTQIIGVADVVSPGRSLTYSYDALGRLSSASSQGSAEYPQWSLAWSYDRYGNRLTQTCSSGNCGALTQALGVDAATNRLSDLGFAYDAAGNLTAFPGTSMAYNATGRLVESATSGALATYEYDAAMTRVAQTVGSTTTVTVTGFGFTMAEYDDGVLARENIQLGGMLIARHEEGTLTYFLHDHLSVRLLTDEAGAIKPSGEQGHYPFGESWYDATPADPEFTSYSRDEESGLDYAVFRQYSSEFGRFTMPDPIAGQIGQPQSWNRYAYVWNDPVNLIDPLGLYPVAKPEDCPTEAILICDDAGKNCHWSCPDETAEVTAKPHIIPYLEVENPWMFDPGPPSDAFRGGSEGTRSSIAAKREWKCGPPPPDLIMRQLGVDGRMHTAASNWSLTRTTHQQSFFKGFVELEWIYKVRHFGEWNYRDVGGQSENFGNQNYGTTGAALGLTDVSLYAGAIAVQIPCKNDFYCIDERDVDAIMTGILFHEWMLCVTGATP